jgi:hypothetical protein
MMFDRVVAAATEHVRTATDLWAVVHASNAVSAGIGLGGSLCLAVGVEPPGINPIVMQILSQYDPMTVRWLATSLLGPLSALTAFSSWAFIRFCLRERNG